MHPHRRGRRSTPAGAHRPVLLEAVLAALDPQPGAVVVDCTLGFAGHATELLRRIGPTGTLVALDLDAGNLPSAAEKLSAVGSNFHLHHANFAGFPQAIAAAGLDGCDCLLADLGMSSMQVDHPD